jgi:hypothetical protein
MKIVSISEWNDRLIMGYVDDGRSYKGFHLTPDGVEYDKPMPKKQFKSLEHFAGVIGKFDPDAFVLDDPLVVGRMDFAELSELLRGDERFEWGGGEAP